MTDFSERHISGRQGLLSLSPIVVFLVMYLAVSVAIGDFYRMPLSVAFITASVWAVVIDRGRPLAKRLETFSRAAGTSNIIYMIWIFILRGRLRRLPRR